MNKHNPTQKHNTTQNNGKQIASWLCEDLFFREKCIKKKRSQHVKTDGQLLISLPLHTTQIMSTATKKICKASQDGTEKVLKRLLKAGASPNEPDSRGFYPVHYAAAGGHAKCLQLLLNAKASLDQADTNNCSPLYIAAQVGHTDAMKLLIDAKADVTVVENGKGTSPSRSCS